MVAPVVYKVTDLPERTCNNPRPHEPHRFVVERNDKFFLYYCLGVNGPEVMTRVVSCGDYRGDFYTLITVKPQDNPTIGRCDLCGKTSPLYDTGIKMCLECVITFFKCTHCGRVEPIETIKLTSNDRPICQFCRTQPPFYECHTCHKICKQSSFTEGPTLWYCDDCKHMKVQCEICEYEYDLYMRPSYLYAGKYYCINCLSNQAHCPVSVITNNLANCLGRIIGQTCDTCSTGYQVRLCCKCRRSFATVQFGTSLFCEECSPIKRYTYKPQPKFVGNPPYYGVELELEVDRWDLLPELLLQNEMIYFKRDGSLMDGFEIVTHPLSLEMHYDFWNFIDDLKKACMFPVPITCGTHIHADFISLNHAIANATLLARCRKYFEKLGGRKYNTFCKPPRYGDFINGKLPTKHHDAVNISRNNTIEYRFMAGTLSTKRLLTYIELVDAIWKWTNSQEDCINTIIHNQPKQVLIMFIRFVETLNYRYLQQYINKKLQTIEQSINYRI